MRLFTKTSIYYVVSFCIILIIGGYIFYKGLRIISYKQIDEGLITEKSIIEEEISHNNDIPDYSTRFGHEIEVILFNRKVNPSFSISDTTIIDKISDTEVSFRHLYINGNSSGRGYSISILHPLTERHLFINSIINTMLLMMLFVFVSLIIFNFLISKQIWKPFYHTINKLRRYEIKSRQPLYLELTDINEFNTLNKVLTIMANKIQADYIHLKEFTEDASHEIQTPLAIINSKMEMLIQSDNLTTQQIESIKVINLAIARLSKLNAGLLLISKIENNQYSHYENILFNDLIKKTLNIYTDFIQHKNIKVQTHAGGTLNIEMNPTLADILMNNLVNNAIKHNIDNGFIAISIEERCFSFENSGLKLENTNTSELFHRFKKRSSAENSIGLGLSIVKKICDTHRLNISYEHRGGNHKITIALLPSVK